MSHGIIRHSYQSVLPDVPLWSGYLLFFMMLFVPAAYKPMKAVLILVLVAMIAIDAATRGRLVLHRRIVSWTWFMVTVGLVFMLIGAINGAPWRAGTVYVVWPLIYLVLIAGINRMRVIDGLFKVIVFAGIAVCLYILSFILHSAGWLPDALYIELDLDQQIGFYDGFMEYWLYSMSSLLFLLPFLTAALLTWPRDENMPVSRIWLWAAFAMCVAMILLSGRRGLWLIAVIAPLIAFAFRLFLSREQRLSSRGISRLAGATIAVVTVGLFSYLEIVYGLSLEETLEWFATGFDYIGDESAGIRYDQFITLRQEWSAKPFFGHGLGVTAMSSLRSEDIPWAYELSYMALLFHTGLIGFSIYAAAVLWVYWMGLKIIRSGERLSLYMLPVLVGTTCFLIANGTNPYLAKFDYLWVIFLPVALINYWLLTRRKNRARPWQDAYPEIAALYGPI